MSPGARARTAPATMQAMDNLKTLAKELNPVVGSSDTDSQPSLRRKTRILMISSITETRFLRNAPRLRSERDHLGPEKYVYGDPPL